MIETNNKRTGKRVNVSFTIDADQLELVKRLATLRRSSHSQVMRDALSQYPALLQLQFSDDSRVA